jgi:four helix bundle protein
VRQNAHTDPGAIGDHVVVHKLEKLEVWKVARRLSKGAYGLTLHPPLSQHFGLSDQIRRAASSIPANVAEGYGLSTTSQLIRCVRISLGSAYELKSHLTLARELELVTADAHEPVDRDCDGTIRLLIGLLRGLGARLPR